MDRLGTDPQSGGRLNSGSFFAVLDRGDYFQLAYVIPKDTAEKLREQGLPAFREAVWLRDVEEFTYAEIAAMLDIPVGTVMSRISRGRRLLHDRLVSAREAGVESVPESDLGPATRR